jgi:glycosyltransferase involved in cell wall biosynthesis
LFIAGDLPWPADGGGRIATLRNLEAMAERYDIDLVALADPAGPLDLGYLESICRRVVAVEHPFTFGRHRARQLAVAARSLFSVSPYRITKFRSRRLQEVIMDLRASNSYDFVHYDQFGVVPYWQPGLPTTHACQNVESDVYRLATRATHNPVRRLWAWQEATKLRRAEGLLLPRFDEVFVLATDDARLLHRRGVQRTTLLPMPAPAPVPRSDPPVDARVLTLGTMSWFGVEEGLLWFRERVWPRVRALEPRAEWHLVGPNAGPRIRRLDGSDGIHVRGYVDQLAPVLGATRVAVIPLHIAGGIRMKLLDLLAAGVPSVSTSVGARGLGFADGEGCFRCDEPDAFADAVVRLLHDDDLWLETVRRGQRYVEDHHTESAFRTAVDAGIRSAIRHHESRVT